MFIYKVKTIISELKNYNWKFVKNFLTKSKTFNEITGSICFWQWLTIFIKVMKILSIKIISLI